MDVVTTKTENHPWRRVYAANSTASAASIIPKTDVATLPTVGKYDIAAGQVIDLSLDQFGSVVPDAVKLKFYVTGGSGKTGVCRVYGLARVFNSNSNNQTTGAITPLSYSYTLLAAFTFTLSNATGVAGGGVLATEYYADTIAEVFGSNNITDQTLSPAGSGISDYAGHVVVDLKGFRYIFFDVYQGAANPATDVNLLYAGY